LPSTEEQSLDLQKSENAPGTGRKTPEGVIRLCHNGYIEAPVPPLASQALFDLVGSHPWPLQEFWPLHALFAVLHALVPLQELIPMQWTVFIAVLAEAGVRDMPFIWLPNCPDSFSGVFPASARGLRF